MDHVAHHLSSFRFGRPVVNVTIVLTYACNMRCPYCYETASHPPETTMTPEMARRVVADIVNRVEAVGAGGIALTLYGGEPMVNRKVARQIVDELRDHVTRKQLAFETTLISNGTLITPEAIEELRFGLRFVQLTLEGSPAYHDRVRVGPGLEDDRRLLRGPERGRRAEASQRQALLLSHPRHPERVLGEVVCLLRGVLLTRDARAFLDARHPLPDQPVPPAQPDLAQPVLLVRQHEHVDRRPVRPQVQVRRRDRP
ncbi:MAG: radical SAM protein [Deltaproteobacteria bacterium]|nr:MAG: radical SAM protein [Deltaproteobacteria bacterium]